MFCPKCKAEYRKGFNRCSDCDIELVSSLPESGKEDEEENKLMKDRNNNEDITPDFRTILGK